jgi:hypothetical protein
MLNLLMIVSGKPPTAFESWLSGIPPLIWVAIIITLPIAFFAVHCIVFAREVNQDNPSKKGFEVIITRRRRS